MALDYRRLFDPDTTEWSPNGSTARTVPYCTTYTPIVKHPVSLPLSPSGIQYVYDVNVYVGIHQRVCPLLCTQPFLTCNRDPDRDHYPR